ncbi:uncharacterized protein [Apostichopus japonicus]|uniref:uncharacterized protein isoform X1 n=1 Tax=Stichopus japonicus TaxID=307972 RepID=UPI003AB500E0
MAIGLLTISQPLPGDDPKKRVALQDSSETGENKESDKDTSMKTDDEDKAPEAVKAEEASKLPASTETSPKTTKAPADVAPPGTESAPQDGTADDEDSDDDSEDDDVQITIGDIKSGPPAFPPYGTMKISAYRKTNTAPSSSNTSVTVLPPKPEKTLDLEAEGTINGVGVYSFDLDTAQEKPWNKPGADITDYFNYGLNEETWKTYSEKQRKLRMEHKITVHHAGSKDTTVPPGEESVKSIPPPSTPSSWNDRHKKPFVRNQNQQGSGAISVIGSSISTISGRRDNDGGIKFNGVAVVSSSGINTVQTGTPLVSLQRTAPSTIPTMHSGPPPGSIPVMQMSQPPPNMGQPPPGFAGPPMQQAPTYHSGPPQAPFMPMPMNRPPPIMNRPPPPAFNNAMPPPPMGGMNIGPPPTGIPPPNSGPPPISSAPPRMPGPPPPQQGDNWNRPPFFPNANAPHFTPRTPVTPMRAPTPGHGPGPSPSPGPGPGPPGGPQWDRPVAGFPSFQDQWSPRAASEESDISSGSEDYKRSPKGANPVRGPGADERRDYRSREGERPRDRERRGRYSKDSSRERDKKHRERSHDRDKERDRKSRDKEDRHRKRKDRDEERSDGHRSSRHKRSKHSHRDSEKEDRSSSHGRDEMGKDLVIADSI